MWQQPRHSTKLAQLEKSQLIQSKEPRFAVPKVIVKGVWRQIRKHWLHFLPLEWEIKSTRQNWHVPAAVPRGPTARSSTAGEAVGPPPPHHRVTDSITQSLPWVRTDPSAPSQGTPGHTWFSSSACVKRLIRYGKPRGTSFEAQFTDHPLPKVFWVFSPSLISLLSKFYQNFWMEGLWGGNLGESKHIGFISFMCFKWKKKCKVSKSLFIHTLQRLRNQLSITVVHMIMWKMWWILRGAGSPCPGPPSAPSLIFSFQLWIESSLAHAVCLLP